MRQKLTTLIICFTFMFYSNAQNVGVGTPTPQAKLSVGLNSEFQVDSTGNIKKINNISYSFPATQSANNQILMNNGTGQLIWINNNVLYASATGVNNYILTTNPIVTNYSAGTILSFIASASNTGAATINLNSLGIKAIYKNATDVLIANDILAGQVITIIYDGTDFQLVTQNSKNQTGHGNGSNPVTLLYLSRGF
jgi:hypothetical protein